LRLDDAGRGLWLGVGREGFGAELNFNSPWREFLEKLAAVSAAALKSIDTRRSQEARRRREEEERLRAAENEWFEKITMIGSLTLHDLIHLIRVQRDLAEDVMELLDRSADAPDGEVKAAIGNLIDSARMAQELTCAISNVTRWKGPADCPVKDAARQAEQLFKPRLRMKRIAVRTDIPPGTVANVPLTVGSLVIAALLGNAIEYGKADGTVTIKAEVAGDAILCHVINDGEPVPPDVLARLFGEPLPSQDGHNGWSLFITPRLLRKYKGEIRCLYSNKSGTCFTLRLPAAGGDPSP
ncbi:MAG TPA: sensor histidine kinase, partial [Pyrinomonadaceae bacterium]|nr:sensor histidine kinase [Pyrinomonadaceae bacterium]